MHFDFTLTLGDVLKVVAIGAVLWRVEQVHGWIKSFLVEHEFLISDYCERNHIKPSDLPTRQKGIR